ncbi:hypothetical protein [Duganella callida]|uniref:PEP-CTERM sorting domain-containing protein n=1 Tax=Duganella callida TaxID=2561932 RepID=A0A4Y9S4V3_9BURK|nr:hypothetical protein [Duganella callida]TFW16482.1 hypothetical protein E4L98_23525 [Duganella callida]
MKHLKLLPFLIAASFYVPRAHAAEAVTQAEPGSLTTALVCLGLVLFAGARGHRAPVIQPQE